MIEIINILAANIKNVIEEDDNYYRSRCVMSANIAQRVLESFGIPAKPIAVNVMLTNDVWFNWVMANPTAPPDSAPSDANVYIVDDKMPPTDPSMWPGHLVLKIGKVGDIPHGIFDPDIGQFRDHKATTAFADIPDARFLPFADKQQIEDFDELQEIGWMVESNYLMLRHRPSNLGYIHGADWDNERFQSIVARLQRIIKHDGVDPNPPKPKCFHCNTRGEGAIDEGGEWKCFVCVKADADRAMADMQAQMQASGLMPANDEGSEIATNEDGTIYTVQP